jgi:hypothetical protein
MRRRTSNLQRHITAHHEAAHAVMAFRFGYYVEVVALCNEGPRFGYVRFARPPLILAAIKERRYSCSWPILIRDTERCAMVLLAGAVAESKLLRRPLRSYACESDLRKCLALCELLSYDRSRHTKARCTSAAGSGPAEIANLLRRRTAHVLNRADVWRAVRDQPGAVCSCTRRGCLAEIAVSSDGRSTSAARLRQSPH